MTGGTKGRIVNPAVTQTDLHAMEARLASFVAVSVTYF
jgi:hypothetical protein